MTNDIPTTTADTSNENKTPDRFETQKNLAAAYNVSADTVKAWVKQGLKKTGRYFLRETVDEFVESMNSENPEDEQAADPEPEIIPDPPANIPEIKFWRTPELESGEAQVTITIPVCVDKTEVIPRNSFSLLRDITPKQRFGFDCLMQGMKNASTEMQHGGTVNNHINAIRTLLEQIADQAAEAMQ